MTDNIRTQQGWTGFPAASAAVGSSTYLVGPVSKGAPFQSLADAVAQALSDNTPEPIFYLLTGGDYTANVTLPFQSTVVALDVGVSITGQISTSGQQNDRVVFELVVFSPAAGVGLAALYAGSGGGAQIVLRNCRLNAAPGATGLQMSGCVLVVPDTLNVILTGGTGIDLVAGADFNNEGTSLIAVFIACLSTDDNDVFLRQQDGAPGSTNQVATRIDRLNLSQLGDGLGIVVDNANTVETTNAGLQLGEVRVDAAGPGTTPIFLQVNEGSDTHQIQSISGYYQSGRVLDLDAQDAQVEVNAVSFPNENNTVKGAWRLAHVVDGTAVIRGGVAHGGTSSLFHVEGGNNQVRLEVNNLLSDNDQGGIVLSSAALDDTVEVSFRSCRMIYEDAAAGNPKFLIIGAGASAPEFDFVDCTIEGEDDALLELSNANLRIENTIWVQGTAAAPCIRISTAIIPISFSWVGSCELRKPTGGGAPDGFALWIVNDTDVELRENGLLQIGTAPDEQFQFQAGGDGGPVAMVNNMGARPVCAGVQSAAAVADIVGVQGGVGVPSIYPGLHIVSQVSRTLIASGADDTASFSFNNEDDGGVGAATAAGFGNPGVGVASEIVALDAPRLVGPGQQVTLACSALTAGGATDVQVQAS